MKADSENTRNKENKKIIESVRFENGSSVETLYFLGKKCFKIKQDIEYGRDQFYLGNKDVLKVFFNHSLIRQMNDTIIYFFTKVKNRMDFSRLIYLNFVYSHRHFNERHSVNVSYIINQETSELIKNSKLDLIKNSFLRLFYNDTNDIIKELAYSINNFEQDYNLTSSYFLFETGKSKKEINDDLFEQYYKQIYDVKYNSSDDTSIHKLFIKNNYKLLRFHYCEVHNDLPDFIFELNFLRNVIIYKFNISFSKIILNILTILSLWFNLCILDLHIYVYYAYSIIPFSFIFAHKLLIRIRNLFKSLIIVNC